MSQPNATSPSPPTERITLREMATSAIRFWEPCRLLYNAVLGAVVLSFFFARWPESRKFVTLPNVLGVFILAVLANACYCTAYVVDIFTQFSDFRGLWLKLRWVLFAIGLAFAGTLTGLIAND